MHIEGGDPRKVAMKATERRPADASDLDDRFIANTLCSTVFKETLKMAASETFSVRFSPETKKELEEYAKATQRSSAFIVKEAVEAHLAERRAYLEAVEKAIRESEDTGEYVSWEATTKWMESWGTENELPPPEPDIFDKKRP